MDLPASLDRWRERPGGPAWLERLPGLAAECAERQDFQGSNVLLSERGWLAIDAKPIVGERAFDTASLIRDRRWELDARTMRRRLDVLEAELGLDRERMRLWALVHALAWEHPEVARLLAFDVS